MKHIGLIIAIVGLTLLLLPQVIAGKKDANDPVANARRKAGITLCLFFMAIAVIVVLLTK